MTIVEAYSVGTPVIGPNMGNVGNLIRNGHTGYTYQLKDSQELCNCIKNSKDLIKEALDEYKVKYKKENNYYVLSMIYKRIEM